AKMRTLYTKKFGSELVRKIQVRLDRLGYGPGKADGRLGSRTRRAIRWFQKARGLPIDGDPSEDLLRLALEEQKKAPRDIKAPPPRRRPLIYKAIMTPERLGEAKAFYAAHGPLLMSLERTYNIPGEIAVGILTVETRMGTYLGEKSAFITLASMALCNDFSRIASYFKDEILTKRKRRWLNRRTAWKADWAYEECKALLTYARTNDQDPLTIPGSFYGAIGISQFMPTKVLNYGVDGNGDGVVDMFVLEDALFSMGNYLQAHGWKGPMKSRRRRRRTIYRYNFSKIYVNTVMAVADYLRTTGK
ncbi:MAG: peptidoglycan-binding protein, partial [Deltaproteobacteria bacterium]|nr:peptidoglycan-binding protein [Deltaproteobacteria bacterium]